MISSDQFRRHWFLGLIWLVCTLTVVGLFAIFYSLYGHSGLPIGWDTPRYLGQMSYISRKGVFSFIQDNEYYNFGYAILSSTLVIAGLSPFVVEIALPIILCISIVVMSGLIVKRFLKDSDLAIYAAIFAASWFAVYRLGADLHPNLLTLAVLLVGTYFFFSALQKERVTWSRLWLFLLLVLTSFTHVETTAFFTFVLLISALWLHKLRPANYTLKKMLFDVSLMLLLVLPSFIFYIQHMRNLLSYTDGVLVASPTLSIEQWISFLGILFPLTISGFCLTLKNAFRGRSCPYAVFICSWASASIAIALTHYVFPTIQIFSERALMLFPVPFLASIGLKAVLQKIKLPLSSSQLTASRRFKGVTIVALVFVTSLLFTYFQVGVACRVWISASAYEKLTWLSDNYSLELPPIFVLNDYDVFAGTLGDLYNNWIQAIYGDHYSYLGDISLFLARSETSFNSLRSRVFSSMFLGKMEEDRVFDGSSLFDHKIVLITDFYLPRPLPSYDKILFDEINDGIFVINPEKAMQRSSIYVPLYSSIKSETSTAGWSAIHRDWAKSVYALEFWAAKPSTRSCSEFLVPITRAGNYGLLLRYWDGDETPNDLVLELSDSTIGKISYSGTAQPANFSANVEFPTAGVYVLRVILEYTSGQHQYASLDYLEISLNE